MKINLPILGEIRTGKDAQTTEVVREVKAKEKPKEKEKALDYLGGTSLDFTGYTLSGEKTVSTKLLNANRGWVYRNNDAIAQEVSKIDFELYTLGLSEGQVIYNELTDHPLLDLLDNPNEETTKSDLIYVLQSHKKLTGDSFILKVRKAGQVVALRTLQPDKIELDLQQPTESDPTTIKAFVYKDKIDGKNIKVIYQPEDIIHIKKPNPNNQFRGIGTVEAIAETIDLDNLTTETTKKFFQNGAITNFVLSTDSKLNDEQIKRLNAELKASYTGPANAYKAMILGGGLKPMDISYSNKDLEMLGQLEWYRNKIMVCFGNTPASLGIIEDVNRANAEATIASWLRNTIKPDMEAIVNALNMYLVPEFGENLVLGFKDPVPEDRADDIQEVKDLYPQGVITLNEARGIIDMDEVEGGDEFVEKPSFPAVGENKPEDEDENA